MATRRLPLTLLPCFGVESGLMTRALLMIRGCISGLDAVRDPLQPFCLIQAPPNYRINHDTIDELTETDLQSAVDFHMRPLRHAGYIAPEQH